MKKNPIKKEAIIVPTILVVVIWSIFILQNIGGFKDCYGIIPLSFKGLRGVFLAPLFHGNLKHILSNTVPLFVLTFFTFQFYKKLGYFVLVNGWIVCGLLVWIIPDFSFFHSTILSCHIGASGLIYLLAFFLFFSGIFRKELTLMAVSLLVVFLYGGIVWGMMPKSILGIYDGSSISWESHLAGGITGLLLAFILRKIGRKNKNKKKNTQQIEMENKELWQQYKQEYPEHFYDEEDLNNDNDIEEKLESIKRKLNYKYKKKE